MIEQLDLEHVCNDNFLHLDKHNTCSNTSISIWIVLPDLNRKNHQFVLSINAILYYEVRWICIFYLTILSQDQILVVPNKYQQVHSSGKVFGVCGVLLIPSHIEI